MMNAPQYLDATNNTLSSPSAQQGPNVSKKRSRGKVTFATTYNSPVVQVESRKEDRDNAWYSQGELDYMRKAVKVQAKHYKEALACGSNTLKTSGNSNNMSSSLVMPFKNSGVEKKTQVLCNSESLSGSNSTFRGLEHRIFIERQRNRIIASKTVLEYQRRTQELVQASQTKGLPEEKVDAMKEGFSECLGEICSQLSAWSRDEAISTAKYDATSVYGRFVHEKLLLVDNSSNINMSSQCRGVSTTVLKDRRSMNTSDETSSYYQCSQFRCIYNSQDEIVESSKQPSTRTPCLLTIEIKA